MSKNDNEFPQKYAKKLPPEFLSALESASEDEIKARLLISEGNIYEVEAAKANDEKLAGIKELAKEHSAPYRESKSLETAKIAYCMYILEQRGIKLNP